MCDQIHCGCGHSGDHMTQKPGQNVGGCCTLAMEYVDSLPERRSLPNWSNIWLNSAQRSRGQKNAWLNSGKQPRLWLAQNQTTPLP